MAELAAGGFVGIDPGASGGVAYIYGEKCVACYAMPDMYKLADDLERWQPKHIYIEKSQAFPGQGVSSMFNYGVSFGMLQGVCITLKLPFTLVPPVTWSRIMHKGTKGDKTKARSIEACQRLFPLLDTHASERARKPHIGIVEAVLIAEYGRREYTLANSVAAAMEKLKNAEL